MDEHDPVSGALTARAVVDPDPPSALPVSFDDLVIDLRGDAAILVPPTDAVEAPEAADAAGGAATEAPEARAVLDALDESLQDLDVPLMHELPAWPAPRVPEPAAVDDAAVVDGVVVEDPVIDGVVVEDPVDDGAVDAPDLAGPGTALVTVPGPLMVDSAALPVRPTWVAGGPGWEHEPARWRTTQLVLAVVIALLAGLGLGVVAAHRTSGGGAVAADVRPTAVVVRGSGAAAAPVAGANDGAGAAPRAAAFDAAAAAADAATRRGPGSYFDPFPVGARATLHDPERGDLDVVVLNVDRDPWPRLKATNAFNTAPPANLRYVMATVAVVYHAGTRDRVFDGVSGALVLSAFGSAGREHRDAEYPVIAPQPLDRSADLLDGGSVFGSVVFAVEADSMNVALRVQRTSCSTTCGEVWISLL